MADDQTQTPDPSAIDPAVLQRITQQLLNPQSAQPQEPPHSGDNRTWGSLLGQALVGGAGPGSTDAQNEQAGLRALQQVGLGMMAGSDYSQARHSLGSIVAGAIGGAQESNAAQNAAQLEYQKTQQEMQLARIKEALPLLQLMQGQQQLAGLRGDTRGGLHGTPPGTNVNIGAVGGGTYEGAIAGREGTGANPNSTALGTGQFLASTWQDFAKANPELFQGMTPDQVLAARTDPALGTKAITWLAQQNADVLTKAGVTPSGTSLGVAHYLGAGAAAKVMQAADNAPISSFVNAAAVKANPELATMTVGQLKQRYANTPAPAFLGGPRPGAAPAPAVTAQTPPAASTAAPGVAQGDIAHPELAPGPPGSTGGAPIGIGAAVGAIDAGKPQYTVVPPPSGKGTPLPAGKLLSQNVDAEGHVIADNRTPQEIRLGGVQVAGPGAGPSLPPSPVAAPVATPQPGWGAGAATGYNVGTNGAAPPAPQLPAQARPQLPAPAPTAQPFTFRVPTDLTPAEQQQFNPNLPPETLANYQQRIRFAATTAEAQQARQDLAQAQAQQRQNAATNIEKERARQVELWKTQTHPATDTELAAQGIAAREPGVIYQADNTGKIVPTAIPVDPRSAELSKMDMDAFKTNFAEPYYKVLKMRPLMSEMEALMHRVEADPLGGQGGIGAEYARKLQGVLGGLGLTSPNIKESIGAQEAYSSLANQLVLAMKQGVSMGNVSNMDLAFLESAAPNLATSPKGRRLLMGGLRQLWDYQEQLHDAAAETIRKPGHTLAGLPEKIRNMGDAIPVFPDQGASLATIQAWKDKYHPRKGVTAFRDADGNMKLWGD